MVRYTIRDGLAGWFKPVLFRLDGYDEHTMKRALAHGLACYTISDYDIITAHIGPIRLMKMTVEEFLFGKTEKSSATITWEVFCRNTGKQLFKLHFGGDTFEVRYQVGEMIAAGMVHKNDAIVVTKNDEVIYKSIAANWTASYIMLPKLTRRWRRNFKRTLASAAC